MAVYFSTHFFKHLIYRFNLIGFITGIKNYYKKLIEPIVIQGFGTAERLQDDNS